MKERAGQRVGVTVGAGTATGVAMVLLGMEPRLALVGCVVVAVSATVWLLVDLANVVSPVFWHNYGTVANTSARSDRSVQMLQTRLRTPARRRRRTAVLEHGRADPADEITVTLLDVIEDHLVTEHGIDMLLDPHAAAEALGPELTRFVTDSTSRRSMAQPRTLARTLTLIEDFSDQKHLA
ncbi:hypothetical protein [Ilumatobacter sp.]|uniref:hypothetical protein n=1 Tax=Ilumatobacter sp. TaxID=1967498 RepID=UPI003750524B